MVVFLFSQCFFFPVLKRSVSYKTPPFVFCFWSFRVFIYFLLHETRTMYVYFLPLPPSAVCLAVCPSCIANASIVALFCCIGLLFTFLSSGRPVRLLLAPAATGFLSVVLTVSQSHTPGDRGQGPPEAKRRSGYGTPVPGEQVGAAAEDGRDGQR